MFKYLMVSSPQGTRDVSSNLSKQNSGGISKVHVTKSGIRNSVERNSANHGIPQTAEFRQSEYRKNAEFHMKMELRKILPPAWIPVSGIPRSLFRRNSANLNSAGHHTLHSGRRRGEYLLHHLKLLTLMLRVHIFVYICIYMDIEFVYNSRVD